MEATTYEHTVKRSCKGIMSPPKKRLCSTVPAGNPRPTNEDAESDDDLDESTQRKLFFEKFRNRQIYVDRRCDIPRKVWFGQRGTDAKTDQDYDIVIEGSDPPPFLEEYKPRFLPLMSPGQPSENTDLCDMISILDQMSKSLKWQQNEGTWIIHKDKGKRYRHLLTEIAQRNRPLVSILRGGPLLSALEAKMTNSSGGEAVKALFTAACYAAFGQDAMIVQDIVQVRNVGSSCTPSESFPVGVVPGTKESPPPSHQLGDISSVSDQDTSYRVGECGSSDPGSTHENEIYTDIMVVTCHNPKWPRCLFVSEIQSEPLDARRKAQILCQMLGPLMNQNCSFGLLINHREAYLYYMERDATGQKRINVSSKYYPFLCENSETQSIGCSSSLLSHLFVDIVTSLYYGKNNIKEC